MWVHQCVCVDLKADLRSVLWFRNDPDDLRKKSPGRYDPVYSCYDSRIQDRYIVLYFYILSFSLYFYLSVITLDKQKSHTTLTAAHSWFPHEQTEIVCISSSYSPQTVIKDLLCNIPGEKPEIIMHDWQLQKGVKKGIYDQRTAGCS